MRVTRGCCTRADDVLVVRKHGDHPAVSPRLACGNPADELTAIGIRQAQIDKIDLRGMALRKLFGVYNVVGTKSQAQTRV